MFGNSNPSKRRHMKTIVLVFGTRPEAIKLAPVYIELKHRNEVEPYIWLTGQHDEMLKQAMNAFDLPAHKNFSLMRANQTLSQMTVDILTSLDREFHASRPDLLLVQGDTTTCFAASLAAFYHKIPLGHVEAGLRTMNSYAPFPEEMNRRLTTRLARLHFAPTEIAKDNLLREGISSEQIFVTGNTIIDALDLTVAQIAASRPELPDDFPLTTVECSNKIVLITGHRRENFGKGLENLCHAISTLAKQHDDVLFIYPVHLNPNVQEPIYRLLGSCKNVHLSKPLSYKAFIWLMKRCYFLLSDSGGVQEEAPHLGKPVLVMRDNTERPEGIEAGTSKLVGTTIDSIVGEASRLLTDRKTYMAMSEAINPYGDGKAAKRIVDICCRNL